MRVETSQNSQRSKAVEVTWNSEIRCEVLSWPGSMKFGDGHLILLPLRADDGTVLWWAVVRRFGELVFILRLSPPQHNVDEFLYTGT